MFLLVDVNSQHQLVFIWQAWFEMYIMIQRGDETMKKALVFSGGGARGAYQLGVWKALNELEIEFDIVAGTSIGSLNGALYVQGDFEKAQNLWYNVSPQDVIDTEYDDPKLAERSIILKSFLGGASTKPLEKLLEEHIDETKVRQSHIHFGIVTVGFPTITTNYLPIEKIEPGYLHRSLLASSTVYPAFKPVKIHQKYFIDGGFQDNLPINLALEMGANEVFAVDLKAVGLKKKVKRQNQVKIEILYPSRPLGSILLFDREVAKKNAQLGYLDTLRHFGKLSGKKVFFRANNYKKYMPPIQKKFFECIHKTLEGREIDFFDLFRVVSNLFLFKKTKIDATIDQSKFLLHAIDHMACITDVNDLEIQTFASFYREAKSVLDDFSITSPDLKQVREGIVYIKNALRRERINPRFYLTSMTNPSNALAAYLAVAAELLSNETSGVKANG